MVRLAVWLVLDGFDGSFEEGGHGWEIVLQFLLIIADDDGVVLGGGWTLPLVGFPTTNLNLPKNLSRCSWASREHCGSWFASQVRSSRKGVLMRPVR